VVLRPKRAGLDRDAVQARVPEVLLAAGLCRAPDPTSAAAPGSDGLPSQVWVAVSRERIYAFEARPGSVGELVGTWDRHRTVVQTSPTLATTRLSFGVSAHGPRFELESRRLRISNHRLVRYLLNPNRTT
jgi:hypothetical protein